MLRDSQVTPTWSAEPAPSPSMPRQTSQKVGAPSAPATTGLGMLQPPCTQRMLWLDGVVTAAPHQLRDVPVTGCLAETFGRPCGGVGRPAPSAVSAGAFWRTP